MRPRRHLPYALVSRLLSLQHEALPCRLHRLYALQMNKVFSLIICSHADACPVSNRSCGRPQIRALHPVPHEELQQNLSDDRALSEYDGGHTYITEPEGSFYLCPEAGTSGKSGRLGYCQFVVVEWRLLRWRRLDPLHVEEGQVVMGMTFSMYWSRLASKRRRPRCMDVYTALVE